MKKIIVTLSVLLTIAIPLSITSTSMADGIQANNTSGGVLATGQSVGDASCSPKPDTTQAQDQQIVAIAQKLAKMGNILGNPLVQQYYSLINQYDICSIN